MNNNKEELRSLNQELPTLFVEELENRLETDSFAVSSLFVDSPVEPACIIDIDIPICGVKIG